MPFNKETKPNNLDLSKVDIFKKWKINLDKCVCVSCQLMCVRYV